MIEIGGQLEELKDAEETESVEATLKVVAKYIPKRMALYEERKKAIAKLDKFWGFVISENEDLESMIDNENDLVLLSALEDITVKYNEQNPATYQIKFTFAPNDFLSGNTITVNVTASNEQEATVKVTPIQWKKGKNFTAASTNEPANKKKRAAEYDGFFHFFVNSQEAGADDFFNLFLKARGLFPGGDSDSDEDGEGFQFDEMDSDDEDMEEDDE
ncbi:hypothetical protein BCR44DRAFT_1430242 [Catenaria anguillulae PL171]|uniref:Nucleosome assembly protein n=1 Tax=Catenaria anguillulae PL171 TaxID=765915 RepID=A0A1Y2HS86_9FUNG|nr:hypothetical protein BCR44DRAFT_1430242 [Catenaria anguillulae PL171]